MTTALAPDVSQQPVFIALQANHDTLPIIEAIRDDNPQARFDEYPAMVKITAPGRLVVRRESIESHLGRDFDLRELHINLVSLSGEVEESLDEFTLQWKAA
ncbi:phenol 2-monooxygenase P2 subunit [Sphaerotilus hippei]|uniref:Phenol 2-monooxygenase P2 subunit n=1 Tax=Sphaerotilus hippei TaxID=744406 RepID=A0A318H2M8_9BURK|nr:MmoB/DmpM family protein [Sphaerotilus hippei]PXW92300.1 phenol 2-monooxygenase P2 subunit [Sphaerotilus hippei]